MLALGMFGIARLPAEPSVAELVDKDSFSLVSQSTGMAVSLQDAQTAPGTRVILAEYLPGRRADQDLLLEPGPPSGWFYLVAGGSARVIEVVEQGRETYVALSDPAGRDTQMWKAEPQADGTNRLVSRRDGLVLTAVPGVRATVTAAARGTSPSQLWKLFLHPKLTEITASGPGFLTLPQQLALNREPWLDASVAARNLQDYLGDAPGELETGMALVLLERFYGAAPQERNYALTLLLWMLAEGAYARGDAITLALALANASLYADGTEEVRYQLRHDLVAHYRLYREITEWQESWAIAYRLRELPLLAKVLWCYRANQLEQTGGTLDLEQYTTFVDRIEVLRAMHALVRTSEVAEAWSLRGIVVNVDTLFRGSYKYAHFMAMIRQWYTPEAPLPREPTDDELYAWLTRPEVAVLLPDWVAEVLEDYRSGNYYVEVLGRRRDPQARMWVNYQWDLYRDTGYFRGDCGTEAEVSMALWKAAGIAAMAVYHTGKDIGHAYTMYYDPFVHRYISLQDLSYMRDKYGLGAPVTLHPMPLRIHERVPLLHPRPTAVVESYTQLIGRGIDYTLWESLLLDPGAAGRAVFPPGSAPAVLADTDRDGLRDEDEAVLGTLAAQADTDRDGFGDQWEIERGFDPVSTASPSRGELGKALVGHVVRILSPRTGDPLKPAGLEGRPYYRIVRSDETQFHYLISADTGLGVTAGNPGGVAMTRFTGAPEQKWRLLHRDAGSFVIQSRRDETVIAVTGAGLVRRASRSTRDEVWVIR
jgi:hypothetical protein